MRPLLLVVLLSACSNDCPIGDALREYAGPGAKDCGSVQLAPGAGDDTRLQACYAESLAAHQAFFGLVSGSGIDSRFAEGLAYDGRKVARFSFDSCPSGCGDGDPHLFRTVCKQAVSMEGRVQCVGVEGTEDEQICP